MVSLLQPKRNLAIIYLKSKNAAASGRGNARMPTQVLRPPTQRPYGRTAHVLYDIPALLASTALLSCVCAVLHKTQFLTLCRLCPARRFCFSPGRRGGSSRCAVVKTYVDGGKMAEYEKMYAVFVRRGRHGSGAYRAKRRHSAGDRNTSGRAGQSRKHVHRRLMKKIRCPTGERQRIFCGFFVAVYCGLRSSAISVTSKEKKDGKKNQMNNFCYLSDDVIIAHHVRFVKRYLRFFYQIILNFL